MTRRASTQIAEIFLLTPSLPIMIIGEGSFSVAINREVISSFYRNDTTERQLVEFAEISIRCRLTLSAIAEIPDNLKAYVYESIIHGREISLVIRPKHGAIGNLTSFEGPVVLGPIAARKSADQLDDLIGVELSGTRACSDRKSDFRIYATKS